MQIPYDGDILGASSRSSKAAGFLKNLVDVKRFSNQMELPGIGHREGKQTLDDARQFLELLVKNAKSLTIFLSAARLGEEQFCLAVKNGERSAQFVRGVSHKLA